MGFIVQHRAGRFGADTHGKDSPPRQLHARLHGHDRRKAGIDELRPIDRRRAAGDDHLHERPQLGPIALFEALIWGARLSCVLSLSDRSSHIMLFQAICASASTLAGSPGTQPGIAGPNVCRELRAARLGGRGRPARSRVPSASVRTRCFPAGHAPHRDRLRPEPSALPVRYSSLTEPALNAPPAPGTCVHHARADGRHR